MNKKEAQEIPLTIALASLRATTHLFRLLAERGVVSPKDIEDSTKGVLSTLEDLPKELHSNLRENVVKNYEDIRQIAAENWTGK